VSKGAAIDPVAAYRKSGYRAHCGEKRPSKQTLGGGIV
jgi:L-rhamnose isomerase/sugar isomerase